MIGNGEVEVVLCHDGRYGLIVSATKEGVLVGNAEMLRCGLALQLVVTLGKVGESLIDFHSSALVGGTPPGIPTGLSELGSRALIAILIGSLLHLPTV